MSPTDHVDGLTDRDEEKSQEGRRNLIASLAALGIVYGDIGTSPLYAIRACFHQPHALSPSPENVLGVLSLIFWALVLVISLKYLVFVLRADNDGEGGILALMVLAAGRKQPDRARTILVLMGLFGAGLLYGDGVITPAISVLSAVEGLHIAAPALDRFVVPISLGILVALFAVQKMGTGRVGAVFGPVMLVWFFTIAALGVVAIANHPAVLLAVSPHHAVTFFLTNRWEGFVVLGVVFLVVTGAEALYADMGHFGPGPIRLAWFVVVLPALLANYFGQGALLLDDAGSARNPFYHLAPEWGRYPLIVLSTAATVIASQAVISGAFSLSSQAVQLGYFPRVAIVHTSKDERGQVYVPAVNWLLFAAVIGLVLAFHTSGALAAAYGMAITTTMVITALLLYVVARRLWHWSAAMAGALIGLMLLVDLAFFSANIVKFFQGGWFPILLGVGVCLTMTTWHNGRQVLRRQYATRTTSTDAFLQEIADGKPVRVSGAAVYLTPDPQGIPLALVQNVRHNGVLHERCGILTIVTEEEPWVPLQHRLEYQKLGQGLYRLVAHFGYKQPPNVANVISLCEGMHVPLALEDTTFFLGRITVAVTSGSLLTRWRRRLFVWMARNAHDASTYFGIPADQVVEIGARLEL